jgi:glycosyltransferase involved in cell wall biosynthesis
MKILMVISQFHPIVGGAEKQAQLLSEKLIDKGIDVTVVTGGWKFGTPKKEMIHGVLVVRNFSLWGLFGMKCIRAIRMLSGLAYMLSLATYLFSQRKNYDIIHVHQALYPAFVSVLVGKQILRKPVLVKAASSGVTSDINQMKNIPFGSFQLRYMLGKLDCLVVVSKASENEFREMGYLKSTMINIPNGVAVSIGEKHPRGDSIRCISIGRFTREKGIDVLLRAWAKVVQERKTLTLILLGDGSQAMELKRLAELLGLERSVEFKGMVQNVEEYLKVADLFILPSRAEGLSNALLEAMSYGIPCIATHVGGTPEIFAVDRDMWISPGKYVITSNGILVNPDDVEGLSEAIQYLIEDENAREEMGRRGRISIKENYSIDLIADKYVALYQRMLGGKL